MALSTKNASALLRSSPRQSDRQRAELDWWKQRLREPGALAQTYMLYGARYYSLFRDVFEGQQGRVIEFGSGPLPVGAAMLAKEFVAVDTLAEEYKRAGLYRHIEPRYREELGNFDLALVLNVLDHAEDIGTLLADATASLCSGGTLFGWVHLHEQESELHRALTVKDIVTAIPCELGITADGFVHDEWDAPAYWWRAVKA